MEKIWMLAVIFRLFYSAYSAALETSCVVPSVGPGEDLTITCFLPYRPNVQAAMDIRLNGSLQVFCSPTTDGTDMYSCKNIKKQTTVELPISTKLTLTLAKASSDTVGTYVCKQSTVDPKDDPFFKNCTFSLKDTDTVRTSNSKWFLLFLAIIPVAVLLCIFCKVPQPDVRHRPGKKQMELHDKIPLGLYCCLKTKAYFPNLRNTVKDDKDGNAETVEFIESSAATSDNQPLANSDLTADAAMEQDPHDKTEKSRSQMAPAISGESSTSGNETSERKYDSSASMGAKREAPFSKKTEVQVHGDFEEKEVLKEDSHIGGANHSQTATKPTMTKAPSTCANVGDLNMKVDKKCSQLRLEAKDLTTGKDLPNTKTSAHTPHPTAESGDRSVASMRVTPVHNSFPKGLDFNTRQHISCDQTQPLYKNTFSQKEMKSSMPISGTSVMCVPDNDSNKEITTYLYDLQASPEDSASKLAETCRRLASNFCKMQYAKAEEEAGNLINELEELRDTMQVAQEVVLPTSGNEKTAEKQVQFESKKTAPSRVLAEFSDLNEKIALALSAHCSIRDCFRRARIQREMCIKRLQLIPHKEVEKAIDNMKKVSMTVDDLDKEANNFQTLGFKAKKYQYHDAVKRSFEDCACTLQTMKKLVLQATFAQEDAKLGMQNKYCEEEVCTHCMSLQMGVPDNKTHDKHQLSSWNADIAKERDLILTEGLKSKTETPGDRNQITENADINVNHGSVTIPFKERTGAALSRPTPVSSRINSDAEAFFTKQADTISETELTKSLSTVTDNNSDTTLKRTAERAVSVDETHSDERSSSQDPRETTETNADTTFYVTPEGPLNKGGPITVEGIENRHERLADMNEEKKTSGSKLTFIKAFMDSCRNARIQLTFMETDLPGMMKAELEKNKKFYWTHSSMDTFCNDILNIIKADLYSTEQISIISDILCNAIGLSIRVKMGTTDMSFRPRNLPEAVQITVDIILDANGRLCQDSPVAANPKYEFGIPVLSNPGKK